MIKNERQYTKTYKLLAEWKANLSLMRTNPVPGTPDWLFKEQLFAATEEIKNLQKQIDEYEAIRSGKQRLPDLAVVDDLAAWLISWRIYRHWTQRQLAEKLGMHENQIQKYENEDYRCASLDTIHRVAEVLRDQSV